MKNCTKLIPHLNRIEGQIKALKKALEEGKGCKDIVQLALSANNSFNSLKTKLLEEFVKMELLKGRNIDLDIHEDFQQMLKLSKS